ncbi:TATA element modulatory factor-like isoform X2 [Crassostrea angulata]|uniref:TATA element modulatory factor-like isoform X2 n=1 Tax=Magallana angulata TaxID=2784310 RepID=UPI0022B1C92E|nr:TATA element modulatory factor-like isoform X2 [Crassostrea angulata]
MSWWDSTGISSFATQALKNAQKKIDKVLDITEDEASGGSPTVTDSKEAKKREEPKTEHDTGSSWSSWGSFVSDKGKSEGEGDSRSAWSMPWGMDTSFTKQTKPDQVKSSKTPTGEKTEVKPPVTKSGGPPPNSKKGALKLKSSTHSEKTDKEQEENVGAKSDVELESDRISEESESVKASYSQENKAVVDESEIILTQSIKNSEMDKISDENRLTEDPLDQQKSHNKSMDSVESTHSNFSMVESDSTARESPLLGVPESGEKSEEMENNEQINTGELSSMIPVATTPLEVHNSDSVEVLDISEEKEGTNGDVKNESEPYPEDQTQQTVEDSGSFQDLGDNSIGKDKVGILNKDLEDGENVGKMDKGNDQESNLGTSICEKDMKETSPADNTEGVTENESKSQPVDIPSSALDIDQYKMSDLPLSPSTASSLGGTDSDTNKLDSSLDTYTSDETVVGQKMTKSDDSIPEDDTTENIPDSTENQDDEISKRLEEISPSSSYVKCMIEDAMDDSAKLEDTGSDTPSKSECSRSTGGHDSGDEISTTTSSDIEIISTPTSNGDGSRMVDLSPLKISLQKTARRGGSPTHRRTDSQSSSSTNSREGQFEQLSPGRDYQDEEDRRGAHSMQEGGRHDLFPLSEHFENDQQQKLIKKIAELTEILQARESKLVQLSKDNNDMMETNNILRNQIQQLEELRETETEDVNSVSSEFTKRLSEAEKKINQVIREKDSMKKQLQDTQEELAKQTKENSQQVQEKDQQISELLQEGEKLSKQQLQSNNIIKKLRAKEKENDSLITSQKKKLEEQKTELEHLRKVCEVKDDLEKKQTEAINQLNSAVQKQEREKSKLKSDLEDAQERVRGLQTALDNSYKEIAELHRSNAAQDSKAAETALSLEMQVREELKAQLEQERKSNKQEKESLITQIEDLRLTVSRMEKEHNRREDLLRQEISDLQRHLQEDEARNQDLTQNVTSATRPLLRQIENLQSTYAAQSVSWEKLEKNLSDRLVDNQTQLAMVTEKERSANEKVMELSTQVASLESQSSRLRQDKAQLTAQLEMLKTKIQVLEDAKHSETAQIEAIKQQMSQEISDLRKEKVFLETQLDMEKNRVDQERKKLTLAHEQIAQLERDLQRPQSRGSVSPQSVSRSESVAGDPGPMSISFSQDDLERSFVMSPVSSRSTLYESVRQGGGATNLIDSLQSQLKQRDGEIFQLRSDIQQLERTRESMARELVNLTNQNEEIMEKIEELPLLKKQYEELNQRYDALLQMYGEKVEEADELRLDLQDVKEMYKLQIDHLLAK